MTNLMNERLHTNIHATVVTKCAFAWDRSQFSPHATCKGNQFTLVFQTIIRSYYSITMYGLCLVRKEAYNC